MFLQTHGITAKLTSTTRVGFHRYTYPAGEAARVVLHLSKPLMECKMIAREARAVDGNTAIEGSFTLSPTMRRPKPVQVHFVAAFPQPYKAIGDWKDGKLLVEFPKAKGPLLMQVALSYTSIEGAAQSADGTGSLGFPARCAPEVADDWNAWLSRITVEGGTDAAKRSFTPISGTPCSVAAR